MRNFGSIFAAYMIAWAIFFLYQSSIARRITRAEEELRRLREGIKS